MLPMVTVVVMSNFQGFALHRHLHNRKTDKLLQSHIHGQECMDCQEAHKSDWPLRAEEKDEAA
jgi:hypothetical protein